MNKLCLIVVTFLIFNFSQVRYPFQNPDLTIEERIDNLINLLSLEEKCSLMLYNNPPLDRLNIPAYSWWNEGLHGVARAGRATVFPQAIAMAATFNEDLIKTVGDAVAAEARLKYYSTSENGLRENYTGLTLWTPNINIFRDPRWGRGQETYGEDPFLTSKIGSAYVSGLQGSDKILKTAAAAKHFAVHSGPEKTRHEFNAIVDNFDLYNTYLPAFKKLIENGVSGIMCAYNRLNNKPCCGSDTLLINILRKKFGFTGYIVTDCWGLDDILKRHKYTKDEVSTAALAANNSVNLNCGYIFKYLPDAVKKGLVSETTIDQNLRTLLEIKFRLGLFDESNKKYKPESVNHNQNKKLALDVARESMVLLKNDNTLPLSLNEAKKILVMGPMASDINVLLGNYHGISPDLVTFLEGFASKISFGTLLNYSQGLVINDTLHSHGDWLVNDYDYIIVCLGLNSLTEGEDGDAFLSDFGGDRKDIKLPSYQLKFLSKIREKAGKKKIITLVSAGSCVAMKEICDLSDAALLTWYPGEQGGNAAADIIFGLTNPSGKLPVTFYKKIEDLPAYENYNMQGRTYRYFNKEVEFEFGFGLSYSDFNYNDISVQNDPEKKGLTIKFNILNNSEISGQEVTQIYICNELMQQHGILKELRAIKKQLINAGAEVKSEIFIPYSDLNMWNPSSMQYELVPGKYKIEVGSSSRDIHYSTDLIIK